MKNWFDYLDNPEVIANARKMFLRHCGYEFGTYSEDPINQRFDEAQYAQFKIRAAKNYIAKVK